MWALGTLLSRIVRRGEPTIIDHKGRPHRFGSPDQGRAPVIVRLADRRVGFDIVRDPRLGGAEPGLRAAAAEALRQPRLKERARLA